MLRRFSRTLREQCFKGNFLSSPFMGSLSTSSLLGDIYDIHDERDFSNRVINSDVPVIVNFHADWCEPCHALRPLLHRIAKENPNKMHLAEITVDDHTDLIQAFEVTAVPAVIALHEGRVINKFIGLVSDKEIETFVRSILEDSPIS